MGAERREWIVTAKSYRFLQERDDENVTKLIVVMVAQLHEYGKTI